MGMTKDKLQNLDILKNNINNPKRNETDSERIERYMFLFEDGVKPPHYENLSKMLIRRNLTTMTRALIQVQENHRLKFKYGT